MTWGKFFITSILIMLFVWGALFYAYGNFILIDTVVPFMGLEIEWWITWYFICGAISSVLGLVCSIAWYSVGNNYDGRSSLGVKYGVIALVSLALGLCVKIFLLPVTLDGGGWASEFVILSGFIVYYLSSLFAAPDAGKYIPPLSGLFH
jgi:hypothetical protein